MAFSTMESEIKIRRALTRVEDSRQLLAFLTHMEKDMAIQIYAMDEKIRQSVFKVLSDSAAEQDLVREITDYQVKKFKEEPEGWVGSPAAGFLETLDKELQVCRSCKESLEDSKAMFSTGAMLHLKCNGELGRIVQTVMYELF
jgi:hypothetical protein